MKNTVKKYSDKIKNSKFVKKINNSLNRLVLPGFQGIPLMPVLKLLFESTTKGVLTQRAATMTYRIFIALIPIFMALFSAISFLDISVRVQLIDFIRSVAPSYTWPAISEMIEGVVMKQNGVLLITSFVTGLYLTVLTMDSVITSLNTTYFKIETRNAFKQILISFGLILLLGLCIIVGIAIFIAASYVVNYINMNIFESQGLYTFTAKILKWLLIVILVYISLSILYYYAPAEKKYFRFFAPGSVFSTILLVILLLALNVYFSYFSNYNVLYGSIGALFAVMLWLNWSSTIILMGFDLNVSIFVAKEQIIDHKEPELENSFSNVFSGNEPNPDQEN